MVIDRLRFPKGRMPVKPEEIKNKNADNNILLSAFCSGTYFL
jgi:hypothetical protein